MVRNSLRLTPFSKNSLTKSVLSRSIADNMMSSKLPVWKERSHKELISQGSKPHKSVCEPFQIFALSFFTKMMSLEMWSVKELKRLYMTGPPCKSMSPKIISSSLPFLLHWVLRSYYPGQLVHTAGTDEALSHHHSLGLHVP